MVVDARDRSNLPGRWRVCTHDDKLDRDGDDGKYFNEQINCGDDI
jgi:hypothetical protein